MEKELRVKISINKQTGELKVVNGEFDALDNKVKKSSSSLQGFSTTLMGLASGAIGIYALNRALSDTVQAGFAYNKQMEEAKASLIALSVAVQDESIPIMERYANGNKEAIATLSELEKINAQTPHTLSETNRIYKAMYVSMSNIGAPAEKIINLTKQISIAAGAGSIEFNSLLAGVDGLATGTVLANSDLGRFLSSLGLTNKAIKESKDVVKLLEDKLSSFKVPDTMQVSLSNVEVQWNTFVGVITETSFQYTKEELNSLALSIEEINKAIRGTSDLQAEFDFTTATISRTIDMFNLLLKTAENTTQNAVSGIASLTYGTLAPITHMLTEVTRGLNKINLSTDENLISALELEVAMYGAAEKAQKDIAENTNEITDAFYKANTPIEERIALYRQERIEARMNAEEARKQLNKSNSGGKDTLTDEQIKLAQKLKDEQIKLHNQLITAIASSDPYESLNNKFQNYVYDAKGNRENLLLIDEWYYQELEKLNNDTLDKLGEDEKKKQAEYLATLKDFYSIDVNLGLNEQDSTWAKDMQDNYMSMLDSQIALAESTNDWNNGLTGAAGNIMSISTAMSKFHVDELKATKAQTKLRDIYDNKRIEYIKYYGESSGQVSILDKKFIQDTSRLQQANTKNQIDAYGQLSGAVSGMFKSGTDEAKGFYALQQVMAIANMAQSEAFTGLFVAQEAVKATAAGTTAVAVAAQSSPWTGLATAAAMVAMLASIGLSLSGGDSSKSNGGMSSADTFKNQSDLIDATNKPILERLDRQIELLSKLSLAGSESYYALDKSKLEFSISLEKAVSGALANTYSTNPIIYIEDYPNTHEALLQVMEALKSVNIEMSRYENSYSVAESYVSNISGLVEIIDALATYGVSKENSLATRTTGLFGSDLWDIPIVPLEIVQKAIQEFASNILDSADKLYSANDKLKEAADNVTGTSFYASKDLLDAQKTVEKLRGSMSVSEYLKLQIDNIEKVKVTDADRKLLLSNDASLLKEQYDFVSNLGDSLGVAFNNGAEEALNYIDSIVLVSEALTNSRKNTESWTDSFKTDAEKASDLMSKLMVTTLDGFYTQTVGSWYNRHTISIPIYSTHEAVLAQSFEELDKLFITFSTDLDGLTNAEKEALDVNKSLLQSYQDLNIGIENSIISTTDSILQKLNNTTNDKNALLMFQTNISTALTSADRSITDAALATASRYADALQNSANFDNKSSMLFAQDMAARQLENIKSESESQIEYLKDMNTKFDTLNGIVAKLEKTQAVMALYEQERLAIEARAEQEARYLI